MPIRWKILPPPDRLVLATAEGPVGLQEIADYLEALVIANAQPYAKLFDASAMEVTITDDELMLLGARMRAYDHEWPDKAGPLAIVSTRPETEVWARRFLNLAGMRRPARLFDDLQLASLWLKDQQK